VTYQPNRSDNLFTLPNILVMLRFVLAPFLLYTAMTLGIGNTFLIGYIVAAISDFFDGYFARLLKQTTALGSLLDSIADLFLYASITLSFMIVLPTAFRCCNEPLALYVLIHSFNMGVAFAKFGQFPSYHTKLNKSVGYLLFIAVTVAIVTHRLELFGATICLAALAALECVLISIRAKEPIG
jgi:phosphatidylglycerophosphate synthase